MKRILTLLMAVSLLLCLAACGQTQQQITPRSSRPSRQSHPSLPP